MTNSTNTSRAIIIILTHKLFYWFITTKIRHFVYTINYCYYHCDHVSYYLFKHKIRFIFIATIIIDESNVFACKGNLTAKHTNFISIYHPMFGNNLTHMCCLILRKKNFYHYCCTVFSSSRLFEN